MRGRGWGCGERRLQPSSQQRAALPHTPPAPTTAHYNLIEGFTSALALQALAGVYFPIPSATLAGVWIAARHAWSRDYMTKGPDARYGGIGGLHALALVSWFAMSVAGGLKLAGLVRF